MYRFLLCRRFRVVLQLLVMFSGMFLLSCDESGQSSPTSVVDENSSEADQPDQDTTTEQPSENPEDSENPGNPENPENPENPGNPGNSGNPSNPDNSGNPNNPGRFNPSQGVSVEPGTILTDDMEKILPDSWGKVSGIWHMIEFRDDMEGVEYSENYIMYLSLGEEEWGQCMSNAAGNNVTPKNSEISLSPEGKVTLTGTDTPGNPFLHVHYELYLDGSQLVVLEFQQYLDASGSVQLERVFSRRFDQNYGDGGCAEYFGLGL